MRNRDDLSGLVFYLYPQALQGIARTETTAKIKKYGGSVRTSLSNSTNCIIVADSILTLTDEQLQKPAQGVTNVDKGASAQEEKKTKQQIAKKSGGRALKLLSKVLNPKDLIQGFTDEGDPIYTEREDDEAGARDDVEMNDNGEPEESGERVERSLFEFFSDEKWDLVCLGDMMKILEFHESSGAEWFVARGMKANFSKQPQESIFASSSLKKKKTKGSNTFDLQWMSFEMLPHKRVHDVPFFNPDAPRGSSLFQHEIERIYGKNGAAELLSKYEENIQNLQKKNPPPDFIPEPKPSKLHVICAVCKEEF